MDCSSETVWQEEDREQAERPGAAWGALPHNRPSCSLLSDSRMVVLVENTFAMVFTLKLVAALCSLTS